MRFRGKILIDIKTSKRVINIRITRDKGLWTVLNVGKITMVWARRNSSQKEKSKQRFCCYASGGRVTLRYNLPRSTNLKIRRHLIQILPVNMCHCVREETPWIIVELLECREDNQLCLRSLDIQKVTDDTIWRNG